MNKIIFSLEINFNLWRVKYYVMVDLEMSPKAASMTISSQSLVGVFFPGK